MNREQALKVADAVLYEGYMLYPYRPSAIKNRQRWTFGTLYPPAYEEVGRGTESARMHTECLLRASEATTVHVHLRFLQLGTRQLMNAAGEPVASLSIDERVLESWDEPMARSFEFDLSNLGGPPVRREFRLPGDLRTEDLRDANGQLAGTIIRMQYEVTGSVTCAAERVGDNVLKLTIDVLNESEFTGDSTDRNDALLRSLLSAHTILSASGGEFVSLLDPPDDLRAAVAACKNAGNFPVLLGDAPKQPPKQPSHQDCHPERSEGSAFQACHPERSEGSAVRSEGSAFPAHTSPMLLCSPIVLYDYPQIAPESAGDFFDGTEIDEMLTLRLMTLTDDEKNEMRTADDRVRALLERTEATAREQLMRTHGTLRNLRRVEEER